MELSISIFPADEWSYTVGGTSPDFASPQDAANALKINGVSGPIFFNLHPEYR